MTKTLKDPKKTLRTPRASWKIKAGLHVEEVFRKNKFPTQRFNACIKKEDSVEAEPSLGIRELTSNTHSNNGYFTYAERILQF